MSKQGNINSNNNIAQINLNVNGNEQIELKHQNAHIQNNYNFSNSQNLAETNNAFEYANVHNELKKYKIDDSSDDENKMGAEGIKSDKSENKQDSEKDFDFAVDDVNEKKKKHKKEQSFSLIDTFIDEVGITAYHWRIYIILSLFFLADGAEMIVISLLIKELGQVWNLSHSEKGICGSAVFVGFFIGALISGKISDTQGRKPVFVAGAVLVCIFSIASAFANNFVNFLILRALNGFGIGICIPSSSSLAAEITPTKARSWVLNVVWIFFPFGEIFATVLARYLLKRENGWRLLLGFAAIPTVISAMICYFIYESPRFYFTLRNYDKGFIGLERLLARKNFRKNELQRDIINSGGRSSIDNNNNIIVDDSHHDNVKQSDSHQNSAFNDKNENVKSNPNNEAVEKLSSQNYGNPYKGNLHKFLDFNNKLTDEARKIIIQENEKIEEIKPEFKTLLKKHYLLLTILCCLIFYICSFVYYGLIYILPQTIVYTDQNEMNNSLNNSNYNWTSLNNTISHNENDDFLNDFTLDELKAQEAEDEMYKGVILSALSEIPSTLLAGYIGNIPFLGRKGSMYYGFILSGISSILCAIYMKHLSIYATALKFAIDIPFGVIYLYVTEAFPTKIRSISLGVTNSFNRLGGISTPILSQLAFSKSANNPYKIYAVLCFVGALLSYLLPFETFGRNIS